MSEYKVVIPARWASSRLPGKPLREINGKPLLQHVVERVEGCKASEVVVATDDQRIFDAASAWGAKVAFTADNHESGTDRCAEVAEKLGWDDDTVVVNVQGDEPLMAVAAVEQLARNMQVSAADMATLAAPIEHIEDIANPNVVKVVRDDKGFGLYFSRAPIPWNRGEGRGDTNACLRHIGIYAYKVGVLRSLSAAPVATLESIECLEQLRALALGYKIHVDVAEQVPGPGVDTEEDLLVVSQLLKGL